MNVPQLRFDGFDGEWSELSLKEAIDNMVSGVSVNSIDKPARAGKVGVLKTSSISKGRFYPNENKEIIDIDVGRAKLNPAKQTILISRMNTPQLVGEIGYVERDYQDLFLPDRIWMATTVSSVDSKWLTYLLVSEKYNSKILNLATGTSNSMKNISKESFFSLSMYVPNIKEQQKIASFLSLLDKKVKKQQEKIEKLDQFKKGIMEKIFSQELRFKDEDGRKFPEWEEKELNEISLPIKRTLNEIDHQMPVLTISAGKGFLNQTDRFSQVIAGESLGKYTLLRKGELAYNRGASKAFPFGCIYSLQTYEEALVPNVYRSFQLLEGYETSFYEQLFSTGFANKQLRQFVSSSARLDGLLNINQDDFFTLKVPVPSTKEQKEIGDFLDHLSRKNDKEKEKLTVLEEQKKGFMLGMFV